MKDMYPSFSRFFEYCSRVMTVDDKDINNSFIESIPGWLDLFKRERDYFQNAATTDLVMDINLERFSQTMIVNGNAIHATNDQKFVTDTLLNFIINEVKDGEAALLSSLCKLRFGYVKEKMSNPEGNELITALLQRATIHCDSWLGLMAMRMVALQPEERIARGTGYTAKHIELLSEVKTKEWLLKHGGNNIKRHLVSNDLGM